MPQIHYLKGNVIRPIFPQACIAHICNDVNKMGSGVAKSLFDKWPIVKIEYHDWFDEVESEYPAVLGNTIFVVVDASIDAEKLIQTGVREQRYIVVANMIAQHRIMSMGEAKPIRYNALDKCLKDVFEFCRDNSLTLHMPPIGTERAGGSWDEIEPLIKKNMLVDTYIYQWDGT